jgi:hypothetical protein
MQNNFQQAALFNQALLAAYNCGCAAPSCVCAAPTPAHGASALAAAGLSGMGQQCGGQQQQATSRLIHALLGGSGAGSLFQYQPMQRGMINTGGSGFWAGYPQLFGAGIGAWGGLGGLATGLGVDPFSMYDGSMYGGGMINPMLNAGLY